MYRRERLVPHRRASAWLSCAALMVGLSACGQVENDDINQEGRSLAVAGEFEVVGFPAQLGERPHSIYVDTMREQYAPNGFTPHAVMAAVPRVIYMNKDGATLSSGWSDSGTNVSSLVDNTVNYPAWSVSASGWNQVMSCMTDIFAPFNITITDVRPSSGDFIMSMIGGYPQNVGFQQGVGGVSPFSCGIIDRSVVFTFAEVYGSDYRGICETAAQEAAHSFGLDHEYLCADPMTYLYGCGNKTFQNTNAQCGEYSARACQCGGSTQNSVEMLSAASGPADVQAPLVEITFPANNATVAPGFQVNANASDNNTVTRVELYIDGTLAGTRSSAPWNFSTSGSLSDGAHSVRVVASDGANETDATINVTVDNGAPPEDPPDDPPGDDPPGDDPPGDDPPGDDPPGTDPPGDDPQDEGPAPLVGGCSSTSTSNGLPQAALLLMAAMLLWRRRREA